MLAKWIQAVELDTKGELIATPSGVVCLSGSNTYFAAGCTYPDAKTTVDVDVTEGLTFNVAYEIPHNCFSLLYFMLLQDPVRRGTLEIDIRSGKLHVRAVTDRGNLFYTTPRDEAQRESSPKSLRIPGAAWFPITKFPHSTAKRIVAAMGDGTVALLLDGSFVHSVAICD